MATVTRFEDLIIWQHARSFARKIYELTAGKSFNNDFELIRQIRKSSGSVMDNIAEGFDREGNNEFRQFLSVAKASLSESKSQVYRSYDRNYVTKEIFSNLIKEIESLSVKIFNTMEYLKHSDFRGYKFKEMLKESYAPYSTNDSTSNHFQPFQTI